MERKGTELKKWLTISETDTKKRDKNKNSKFLSHSNYEINQLFGEETGVYTNFLQRSKMKANSKKLEKQDSSIKNYLIDLKFKMNNSSLKDKGKFDSNYSFKTPFFIPDADERFQSKKDIYDITKSNFLTNIIDQIYTVTQGSEGGEEERLFKEGSSNKMYKALSFGNMQAEERRLSKGEHTLSNEIMKCNKLNMDFSFEGQETKREIYKFQNVYDSLSDDEFEDFVDGTNTCLIHPESNFKLIWDSLCLVLILYTLIFTPYRLAFYFNVTVGVYFVIELAIDIIFMLDLIFNFFTPFSKGDILVTNSQKIIINYICSWFILDLVSSNPTDLIFFIIDNYSFSKNDSIIQFFKFYRLLKWVRILRIFKLSTKKNSAFFHSINKLISNNFFKFLFSFVVLVYLTSCIWCFLGRIADSFYLYNNWLLKTKMIDADDSTVFVAAVYFVCTTIFTIGYGDIVATNKVEKLFVVVLMIIGSLTWSFVVTSLSFLFSHKEERQATYEKKLEILDELNLEYQLDESIIGRLKKYLYYEYNIYKKDQIVLLESLPGNLKNNLYLNMYEKHISRLQFFKDQSYDFILAVLPLLKHFMYLRNEYILNIGIIVEGVYMLYKGCLGVCLGSFYENYEIAKITSSYHIGDILMYSDDQSPYDVKIKSKQAELLLLSKNNFASLKLSFKDQIKHILNKSYGIYYEIEKKKEAAIEYHQTYQTLKGFNYNSFCKDNQKYYPDKIKNEFISKKSLRIGNSGIEKELNSPQCTTNYGTMITGMKNKGIEDNITDYGPSFTSSLKQLKISGTGLNSTEKIIINDSGNISELTSIKEIDSDRGEQNNYNDADNIFVVSNLDIETNKSGRKSEVNTKGEKNNISDNSEAVLKHIKLAEMKFDSEKNTYNSMPSNEKSSLYEFGSTPSRRSSSKSRNLISKQKSTKHLPQNIISLTPTNKSYLSPVSPSNKNKSSKFFLKSINQRIENEAIMFNNGEILSEYIRDQLIIGKKEDFKFKSAYTKLDKLEQKLKNIYKVNK